MSQACGRGCIAALQEALTVSWAIDIVVMELFPKDREALINVLMSVPSR
jgi:hypothetical protein